MVMLRDLDEFQRNRRSLSLSEHIRICNTILDPPRTQEYTYWKLLPAVLGRRQPCLLWGARVHGGNDLEAWSPLMVALSLRIVLWSK